MKDAFLSYARDDRDRVKAIADALEREGVSVWWDPFISPGHTFDRAIENAIDQSRVVVVIWSSKSIASDWVRAEASEGLRRGSLVPLLLDSDAEPPLRFRQLQTISFAYWNGKRDATEFLLLIEAIRAHRHPVSQADAGTMRAPAFSQSAGSPATLRTLPTYKPAGPSRAMPQTLPRVVKRGALTVFVAVIGGVTSTWLIANALPGLGISLLVSREVSDGQTLDLPGGGTMVLNNLLVVLVLCALSWFLVWRAYIPVRTMVGASALTALLAVVAALAMFFIKIGGTEYVMLYNVYVSIAAGLTLAVACEAFGRRGSRIA